MSIFHIVLVQFKADTPEATIQDVCQRMSALKDQCVHPTTNKPYIQSAVGGKENSPEKLSGGITHAFVEEFASEEDRKYYLEKDPAHIAFIQSLGGEIEKIQVVDFTAGVF